MLPLPSGRATVTLVASIQRTAWRLGHGAQTAALPKQHDVFEATRSWLQTWDPDQNSISHLPEPWLVHLFQGLGQGSRWGSGGGKLQAGGHGPVVLDDLAVGGPHKADGLGGADAGASGVPGGPEPVVLGGARRARADAGVGRAVHRVSQDLRCGYRVLGTNGMGFWGLGCSAHGGRS